MNFVLFLDNCQPVSNTWTLHPFKYLYLDNYNILEVEEYAYFDKTYWLIPLSMKFHWCQW